MTSVSGVNLQTFNRILARQEPPKFGAEYTPSTFATREEAPSISRPAILQSRLLGREVHLLGQPELHAGLLALYHLWLFELHEQKMLWRWPFPHPLTGLPGIDATRLCPLCGTVAVAERLGYLDLHPVLYLPDPECPGRKVKVPFPYQGDLLLFLKRPDVPPYCVNWTVKDKRDDFTSPGPGKRRPESSEARRAALARYEMEAAYYMDAGIRTQPVANEDIDWHVRANLCQLFPYTTKSVSIDSDRRREIVDAYKAALVARVSPMEVILSLVLRQRCTDYTARVILYQAIWNRELRVDLFRPILPDYPLNAESVDVLEHYAEWFLP